MNRLIRVFVIVVSLVLLATSFVACAKPAPAQFEVVSLTVTPEEVVAGEAVTVTAQVKNIGGSEGNYTAVLSIDGMEIERKDFAIAAGATETAEFTVVKDKAGTYQVTVGGLTSSFTVKPKLVAKEVELKYDDGEPDSAVMMFKNYGFLIHFCPQAVPFTIKNVRMRGGSFTFGGCDLKKKQFDLQILNKDLQPIYSKTYAVTKFPNFSWTGKFDPESYKWVEFEIPNIEVNEEFYIFVYQIEPCFEGVAGIYLALDNSVVNEHSDAGMLVDNEIVKRWPYPPTAAEAIRDKTKVNWMIRVVGTAMIPEDTGEHAKKPLLRKPRLSRLHLHFHSRRIANVLVAILHLKSHTIDLQTLAGQECRV